jgi:membrane fusion protein, multidrug efflux system
MLRIRSGLLRSPKRLLPVLGGFALLLCALGWAGFRSAPSKPPGPPMGALIVSAGSVSKRDVVRSVSAVGNVQSLNNVLLRPQIDGILTRVLVQEGDQVEKDQLLAQVDDRALSAAVAQAHADMHRNEANLHIAELNLKRDEKLLAEQAISSQAVDEQRALVEQLKASVESNQAAIQTAEIQKSYSRISSPVAGRVGLRRVDPGNLIHANDTSGLFSVVQVNPISVVFSLPQQAVGQIGPLLRAPQPAEVVVFDRDSGAPIATGHLQTSDNQIDAASGTIQLRALFENAQNALWPGQFVTVQLKLGIDRQVLAVNSQAIQHGLEGTFAFLVKDSIVAAVPVKVRYEEAGVAVLESGVQAGDLLVTEGQDQLRPGMHVRVANPEASATTARSAAERSP